MEYQDLQSETNHFNRIINPYTPIRRITNPAIETILKQWLHAITVFVIAYALSGLPFLVIPLIHRALPDAIAYALSGLHLRVRHCEQPLRKRSQKRNDASLYTSSFEKRATFAVK
ncbi:MAG: hypothetical protein LBT83_02740 [Tannerella sp.]|nr:hypothetical protein [Tannerella sp.]